MKQILLFIVLLVALGGAIWLVKQNQELRKGAYFAGATMQLLPSQLSARVGEDVTVRLWVNAGRVSVTTTPATRLSPTVRPGCVAKCPDSDGVLRSCTPSSDGSYESICYITGRVESCGGRMWCCPQAGGAWTTNMTAGCQANIKPTATPGSIDGGNASVQNVKLYMCYDKKLSMPQSEIGSRIVRNEASGFDSIPLAFVEDGANGKECVLATVVADNVDRIKTGNVEVMSIRLKAMSAGSGQIEIIADKSRISGNNTASNDMAISVDGVTGSMFVVTEGGASSTPTPKVNACYWCGDKCVPTTSGMACIDIAPPAGMSCVAQNGTCVIVESEITPNLTRTATKTPTPTPTVTRTLSPTPSIIASSPTRTVTVTPSVAVSGRYYLDFDFSFAGVTADASCAVGWPVTVTVRAADGSMYVYDNVVASKLSGQYTAIGMQKYRSSIVLDNFTGDHSSVAVFVKGPRHLQVKYAFDGQEYYYDQPGGHIELMSGQNQFVYDFSGYPLLAGDVTGATQGIQDGVVDGRDFSFVKTESLKRTEVELGGYMLSDLNGNCKMESQDVATLMLSLREKQEQLY